MSEKAKIVKGQKFGDWQTIKCLGGGGNAVVWLVSNSASESAAIKLLTKTEGKSEAKVYSRFRKEIEVLCQNRDIEGLLPIIDSYLPEEVGENTPWYVMPVAQPIDTVKWNFETSFQIVLEIGKVLIRLHERGVSHRDVKPANMLIYQGRYYLSDFGLVDHPGKQDLTGTQERIGAKWTIAPEMERNSKNADGKLADVYSLAKTLWILLTGQKLGFEGQYNPSSINGLVNFRLTDLYIRPLEDLIRDSTDDDPLKRPSMFGFVDRLADWIQISKDFRASNRLQWQDIQNDFFPTSVPQRVVWEDIAEIAKVLGYLCSVNLNHMHLPDKGGMDLLSAKNLQGRVSQRKRNYIWE